jgi:hypothetical protein
MDFQQQHRSKQTKPAQILRHSRRPHTIIKMNDNMGMVCTPTEPGHDLYTNRASGYSYLTDYKLGRYNLLAKDHYALDKKKYITTNLITSSFFVRNIDNLIST